MTDVELSWKLPKDWNGYQIPATLPLLFLGDRLVVYGDLNCRQGGLTKSCKKGNGELTAKAILKGRLENKKAAIHHEFLFTFSREGDEAEVNGGSMHRLAAKRLIQEKQDAYNNRSRTWSDEKKDAFKHTVIFISKATNIVSKFTSFVAVDQDNHQPVSEPLKKRPGVWEEGGDFYSDSEGSSNDECEDEDCEGLCNIPVAKYHIDQDDFDENFQEKGDCVAKRRVVAVHSVLALQDARIARCQKQCQLLLLLMSLQKFSGAWDLTDQLVALCTTSQEALIAGCPREIAVETAEGKLLWTTALALVLLMGSFSDQKDEWEMIAERGTKWMKENLPNAVNYDDVLKSAAAVIGVHI